MMHTSAVFLSTDVCEISRVFAEKSWGFFSQVKPGGVTVNIEHIFFTQSIRNTKRRELILALNSKKKYDQLCFSKDVQRNLIFKE